jgi:hypothetical protein
MRKAIGAVRLMFAERRQFTIGCRFECSEIGFSESTVAFGDVCGNRKCCAVELIDEKRLAPLKLLGSRTHGVGKIYCALIDKKLLE